MSKQTAQPVFQLHRQLYKTLCTGILVLFISFSVSAQTLSPKQAADIARATTGGKVLKVNAPKSSHGHYKIKMLLPEGKVKNIIVEGNSGKVKNFPTKK